MVKTSGFNRNILIQRYTLIFFSICYLRETQGALSLEHCLHLVLVSEACQATPRRLKAPKDPFGSSNTHCPSVFDGRLSMKRTQRQMHSHPKDEPGCSTSFLAVKHIRGLLDIYRLIGLEESRVTWVALAIRTPTKDEISSHSL